MTTLPPGFKTFTADNVTGAAVTPKTTCTHIIVYENNQAGTDDYLVSDGGGTIQRPAGSKSEFKAQRGTSFLENVALNITIKRATAGSLIFAQEEYGDQ